MGLRDPAWWLEKLYTDGIPLRGGGGGTPSDPSEVDLIQISGSPANVGRENEDDGLSITLDAQAYNELQAIDGNTGSTALGVGSTGDAAVTTNAAGSLSAKLRGLVARAEGVIATPIQVTKTVAATGTPEALAADGTFCRTATLIGKKAARTNNTGIVYLGIGSGNDTQALEISPGEVIQISAPDGQRYDLNDWYLDVATNADGVIIIYS